MSIGSWTVQLCFSLWLLRRKIYIALRTRFERFNSFATSSVELCQVFSSSEAYSCGDHAQLRRLTTHMLQKEETFISLLITFFDSGVSFWENALLSHSSFIADSSGASFHRRREQGSSSARVPKLTPPFLTYERPRHEASLEGHDHSGTTPRLQEEDSSK